MKYKLFLFLVIILSSFFFLVSCDGGVHVPEIEDLHFEKEYPVIAIGQNVQFKTIITPAELSDNKVTWSSSNPDVATVNDEGLVKGISTGETVITAKAGNKEVSCTVTVKESVSVQFNSNGGAGDMAPQIVLKNTLVKLRPNTFENSGYMFKEWNTESDGTGTSYGDEGEISTGGNITLFAQWKEGSYTVVFNGNGGTGTMNAQSFKYGIAQNLYKVNFIKEGYLFNGWNTSEGGSGSAFSDEQEVSNLTTEDGGVVNLYAQWAANKYDVTFYKNYDTEDPVYALIENEEYDSNYELPNVDPTRDGYTFKGWYTESTGGTEITESTKVTIADDHNLYAQWSVIPPLTLKASEDNTNIVVKNGNNVTNGIVKYQRYNNDGTRYDGEADYVIINSEVANISLSTVGDYVCFYRTFGQATNYPLSIKSAEKSCYVYGNVMSMVCGENYVGNYIISGDQALLRLFYDLNDPDHPNKIMIDPVYGKLVLPATTLSARCYEGMFTGCEMLTIAPELPAETLANRCYLDMFKDCINLTKAPELPATTLDVRCYQGMFSGCENLTIAPELPVQTLANSCYMQMFNGCTSLTNAPELPAEVLVDSCYAYMFMNCTSLTTAPELKAVLLKPYCYTQMFSGCENLTYIKCLAKNGFTEYQCTYNWVQGVSSSGTFVKSSEATAWPTGEHGIPSSWIVEPTI